MKILFSGLIVIFSLNLFAETNPCVEEKAACQKIKKEKEKKECYLKPASDKCTEYAKKNNPISNACSPEEMKRCTTDSLAETISGKDMAKVQKAVGELWKCLGKSENEKCKKFAKEQAAKSKEVHCKRDEVNTTITPANSDAVTENIMKANAKYEKCLKDAK